jgi:broad specificity phosphatase PhoE
MTTRLHLLCSASTSSVSSIAFPADEPLDIRGRESLSGRSSRLPSCDIVLRSPARRAAQTAESLTLDARVEPLLRDCDFGRWAGRSLAEVQAQAPEAVADWLTVGGWRSCLIAVVGRSTRVWAAGVGMPLTARHRS